MNPIQKLGNNTYAKTSGGGAGGLVYPPNLGQSPNFFGLNLRKYETGLRGNFFNEGVHISLPMPTSGLVNSFHMDYETKALGSIGGIAATVSDAVTKGDWWGIPAGIASGIANIGRGIYGGAAAATLGDTGAAGAQLSMGAVNNPNLAVLFKGVGLRTHNFTWEMVAANSAESDTINAIIKTLKKYALPTREAGSNFALKYPYVAFPAIVGPLANELITFSDWGCFIDDVVVDYNGQGHPAYFKDTNNPVVVRLTLKMTERGIVASDDVSK